MNHPSGVAVSDPQDRSAGATDHPRRIIGRAIAACALPGGTTQDIFDCAEAAYMIGSPAAARLLFDTAFLLEGFAPRSIYRQSAIACRTSLWPAARYPAASHKPAAGLSIEVALAELGSLVAAHRHMPGREADETAGDDATAGPPATQFDPILATANLEFVHDLIGGIVAALRAEDVAGLKPLLDDVEEKVAASAPVDLAALSDQPIEVLAAGLTFNRMRDFFIMNRPLIRLEVGSPALFNAAARFESAALGPYLTSVARLLTSTGDLVGLVALALERQGATEDCSAQDWIVLLSSRLDSGRAAELVMDLGRRGYARALQRMLDMATRRGIRDLTLYRAICRAALLVSRFDLAAEAQTQIVGVVKTDQMELVVLAGILAGGGARQQASAIFDRALQLAPFDETVCDRHNALLSGDVVEFEDILAAS